MCGIVGFKSSRNVDLYKDSLDEAIAQLHHRGPDDAGVYVDPEAIPLLLHYQYIPAPKTISKNTYKLLLGSYLVFEDGRP